MTTLIAQGPVDVNVRGLLDRLQARADNAYCDYIGLCRRDECLGWEAKVEKQIFGEAELKAHKDAAEKLGRHRALQEAANLLHELLTPNKPFGDMDGGYFGSPSREDTALDRGLADVNAELRKELKELRSENKRLTAALDAISGTIAI